MRLRLPPGLTSCWQSRYGYASAASRAEAAVDCVVIGAGVVGLACTRALALAGDEVLLVDKAAAFGTETSSRHSEVIHAGIYYPEGSLKARLCVEGKHRLHEYLQAKGVAFSRLGKLIVATAPKQMHQLRALQAAGRANGVPDLQLLSAQEAAELEPELRCMGALWSPSTGILDSHGYMEALLMDAEAAGATLATHTRVVSTRTAGQAASSSRAAAQHIVDLEDAGSGQRVQVATRRIVNAAGLEAQQVATLLAPLGLPASSIPPRYLARGCYFSLSSVKPPFRRLIYPVPEPGGLGVHLTLDLAGQAKFGPDVEWVSEVAYTVDPARANGFYPAVRSYWPGLPDGALQPSYAGIRPKVTGPGQPAGDFIIQGPEAHGVRGLVNLFGIESPGLTSSMAIGRHVCELLCAA